MTKLFHVLFLLLPALWCNAQDGGKLAGNVSSDLLKETLYEGFDKSAGKNDFTYHSLRDDVSDALLTRCTDGKMEIAWYTREVPDDFTGKGANFIWLAAMDINDEVHHFDVYVNGIKRFVLQTGIDESFVVYSNDGGSLAFDIKMHDMHGDAHGYMMMYAPRSWITPGEPVKISITGRSEASNSWIIIYKARDALKYLRYSSIISTGFRVVSTRANDKYDISLFMPASDIRRKLSWNFKNRNHPLAASIKGDTLSAYFSVNGSASDGNVVISDSAGVIVSFSPERAIPDTLFIYSDYIITYSTVEEPGNVFYTNGKREYNSALAKSLIYLSELEKPGGKVYLMSSIHQDIAWMDTPEKCVIERDTMLLMPLFKNAMSDPSVRFDIEDALMLREFVTRHPETREGIASLLREGRLSCGSTFIQPYEEMYSGESLARLFYFGAGWLKKEFNYESTIYWNLDVPGRTLQMPQIMKKSGSGFLMMSRFDRGFFRLMSPDGSSILAYSPGHYGYAYQALQKDFSASARFIADECMFWNNYTTMNGRAVIPLLSDSDMSPAINYSGLKENWNSLSLIKSKEGRDRKLNLPKMDIVTAPEFFKTAEKSLEEIPVVKGERPAMWLYIHGPSHYEALKASREADILLPMAEKFFSALTLIENDYSIYPSKRLNDAWEAKIYPDHGWGGKGGDITDRFFLRKFEFARSEGAYMLNNALNRISAYIKTDIAMGSAVVVFNSLNWKRDDVVSLDLSLNRSEARSIDVFDGAGTRVPSQLTDIKKFDDGSIRSCKLTFYAEGVSPVGYKTYYYRKLSEAVTVANGRLYGGSYENEYYKVDLDSRGIKRLLDKETGDLIIDSDDMRGAEVFTMRSPGNGAGEFSDIQQPDMEGYDYTGSSGNESWTIINDGEVFTTFLIRQAIRNATVEREIKIYHTGKRIDIDVALLKWEGVLFREYRMALPVNSRGTVSYEVPFGVLDVGTDEMKGAAGERYTTECSDIHPRGIQNWIATDNSRFGLTLSSSVAVADYIDPRGNSNDDVVILQPVLLASRQSCNWEGNDYLQTGDHHYHFSFTSHKPGWENGSRFGVEANEKLIAVEAPNKYQNAWLPLQLSFFSFSDENIRISTIKKAEDGDGLIVRAYDYMGMGSQPLFNSFVKCKGLDKVNMTESPIIQGLNDTSSCSQVIGKYSVETFRAKFEP